MRVTHVITRLIVGGAQENTISTVLGLSDLPGVIVDLISGPTTGAEGSLESHFNARSGLLKVIPSLVRPVSPVEDLRGLRALTSIFRETKPEIVHTHSGKAGILGRFAARKAGVPLIIHTIHGPSFGSFQGRISNFIYTNAERWAGKTTTHFVSVADAMTRQYLRAGIGRQDQYTTIWSGFELGSFLDSKNDVQFRSELGFEPGHLIVGKIGRLVNLKGHEDLFEAAPGIIASNPQVRFLLVGDGPARAAFEIKLNALGISRYFVFTGLVRPSQVSRYIGIMDMLVHLSRREGLPRALPQALAAAKPVIAYDCDGAAEICIPEKTGFLIQPGDLIGLVKAVTLLAENPALRFRLGQYGRELVTRRFDVKNMVFDIHRLYEKLLAR
jgi:glycosyltransferase involved in cell wall biosynthesis